MKKNKKSIRAIAFYSNSYQIDKHFYFCFQFSYENIKITKKAKTTTTFLLKINKKLLFSINLKKVTIKKKHESHFKIRE